MAQSVSETGGCSRDIVVEVDSHDPVDQEEEKEEKGLVMSLPSLSGSKVLGEESNKNKMGGRKRERERKKNIDEESPLVAKKTLKPSKEEVQANINSSNEDGLANINSTLPPELLSAIFRFLPFTDLKSALLVCRWWRKMGEDPCLWAKFKLQIPLALPCPCHGLQDVLSLGRLQSLEYFHLKMDLDKVTHHVQIILSHPSIRKLSLMMLSIKVAWFEMSEEEKAKLAALLVKFEEVDLTESPCFHWRPNALGLLRSLIPASAVGDSKLKKLSISYVDEEENSEVLAQARERFVVIIMPRQAGYDDDDDDDLPTNSPPNSPPSPHNEFDLDPDYDPDSYCATW